MKEENSSQAKRAASSLVWGKTRGSRWKWEGVFSKGSEKTEHAAIDIKQEARTR